MTSKKHITIGVVVSRFNDFITKRLLKSCLDELRRQGIGGRNVTVVEVPGSFELPLAAQHLARKKKMDAVIALGAVIRGETIHFELVAQQAASGIMRVGLETGKPVIFGVVATETVNQAYARSKPRGDNKGRDAAQAALEMLGSLKKIK